MKNEKRENFFPKDDSFGILWYNGLKQFRRESLCSESS